jgi:hypothetical protein
MTVRSTGFCFCAAILLALSAGVSPARSSTHPDDDFDDFENIDWFEDDLKTRTDQVNEGELAFLAVPPEKEVHHMHNVVILDGDSRDSGWVRLEQCHYNIDRVARAQIVFHKDRIRNLRIRHAENMGKAWVEGASVQLTDIADDSSLCLEADSRALKANGDGSFRIDNGPFMRRFLDGYYPMRVSERILLADSGLRFSAIKPVHQPGFEVEVRADTVHFDAWFEGQLRTEVELLPVGPGRD